MNLHEFQAKELLAAFQVPVPDGRVVSDAAQLDSIASDLGGERWVVKAQIHAGARGKGGGIRVVENTQQLVAAGSELLGSRLVTQQTDRRGLPVDRLLIEKAMDIASELYLGMLIDRSARRVTVIASRAGGMEIEEIARTNPEQLVRTLVEPAVGLQLYQCRNLGFRLGLEAGQVRQLTDLLQGLYHLFVEHDLSLAEINPLVVTAQGQLLALDAKIVIDDNALFRQPRFGELRDPAQEDEREYVAQSHGLNFISLEGNIACLVNGAGLAMATMDLIKLEGGEPANFLDVGGTATAERVAEAFKLILQDERVEAILVNIFGGIVRCDLIAEGIIQAVQEIDVTVPVVVRLEGTRVEEGKALLNNSTVAVTTADNLQEAARRAVHFAGGKRP